jgi:lipopolysaccharide exporter
MSVGSLHDETAAKPATSLAERGTRAAAWGYAGTAGSVVMTLVSQSILARTLGPAEFGIFSAGSLIMSFAVYFADFGIGTSLIKKDRADPEAIRYAFTVQLIVGALFALALVGSAPLFAAFFRAPGLEPVLHALAAMLFLTAGSAVSLNLLKRELEYRTINAAMLAGLFVGHFVVSVPLALNGWGAVSMAIGWVVQVAISGAMMYRAVRHPLRPLLRHPDQRWMLGFGLLSFSTLMIRFGANNVDRAIVGRAFTTADLALYSSPFNLLLQPVNRILSTLQGLAFATSSRQNDERDAMARSYLGLAEVSNTLFAPVFLGILAAAGTVMTGIYGPAWADAAGICMAACVAMLMLAITEVSIPYLWGLGRGVIETRTQAATLAATIASAWLASRHGPAATAWAVAGVYVLRAGWIVGRACAEIGIGSVLPLLRALRPGFAVGVPLAALLAAWDRFLVARETQAEWRLAAVVAVAALLYAALLFLCRRWFSPTVRQQAARVLGRFSRKA